MPQLVGQDCLLCHARITSTIEGEFCARCGSPVHVRCARESASGAERCPTCGANSAAAAAFRGIAGEGEAAKRSEIRSYNRNWGLIELFGGLALAAAGVITVIVSVTSGARLIVIWYGAILAGAAVAIRGVARLFARPRSRAPDDGEPS